MKQIFVKVKKLKLLCPKKVLVYVSVEDRNTEIQRKEWCTEDDAIDTAHILLDEIAEKINET